MQDRITRCRYLRRDDTRCTAEVADENADILLCPKHLAAVMKLLQERLGKAA